MIRFIKWSGKESEPDALGHTWRKASCSELYGRRVCHFYELRCTRCGWRFPDVKSKPKCDDYICVSVQLS